MGSLSEEVRTEVLCGHICDLEAENGRLRKLAQRMWRLERFGCYGCRHECDAESCYASECKEAMEIEQEMRELGVES